MMTLTGVDMNRDCVAGILRQPQVGFGTHVECGDLSQYEASGSYAAQTATPTVAGADMNRVGIPGALQKPQES